MTAASQIVFVPVNALDAARIASLARSGSFIVCYLSSSYAGWAQLHERLPSEWSMPTPGPALNRAAERLRDAVINLDEQAQPAGLSDFEWQASLLAERGPLVSTLMLNLARLVVFIEWVAQPGRHLVVVDDLAFGTLLLREAQLRNWNAGWLAPGRKFGLRDRAVALGEWLASFVDGARRRASVVRRFLVRKLVLAGQRQRRPLRLEELRKADVLLVVWGRADTFSQDGMLSNEFNFGRLPSLLRQAGFAVAYLAYPLTYVSPFGAIAANVLAAQEPVALIEDFIPWWAILPASIRGLTFPRRLGRLSVLGIDATEVLRLEARRDRRLAVNAEACLLAHVGRRLARRAVRPELVVHLYESQPWEKMLAFGVRKHLPTARIIGVQHSPFAWSYLSFFPSRRNIARAALPDLLLTCGEGYAQWFRDAGVSSARVGVVGAVRFENVACPAVARGQAVLCCTSIELDEAVELATKAAAATAGLGISLLINFHPVTNEAFRTSVRDAVCKAALASEHVTFSPLSMRDLLEQSSVVLYMSSAASFEAVAGGRVAIYVTRDLALDYDKLPNEIALRCNSRESLRETLGHPAAATHRQSPTALEYWLAPVINASELRRLLTAPAGAPAAPRTDGRRTRTHAEFPTITEAAG